MGTIKGKMLINANINLNSNQNIIHKNYNNNPYDNNNNDDENFAYPNLEELDLGKKINYEKADNIEVMESKDEIFDIEIPSFKPIDAELFSEFDKIMKENKIQDDYNDKDENEDRTYKELKKYEKGKLKKIFLDKKEEE